MEFPKFENIYIRELILVARPGRTIGDAVIDAIELCAKVKTNVTLKFNDKVYQIMLNDLYNVCKEVPIKEEEPKHT